MSLALTLAEIAAPAVQTAWQLAGMALVLSRLWPRLDQPIVRHVFHELKPLFLPAVVASPLLDVVAHHQQWGMGHGINIALGVWNWWLLRNEGGDDDRWKKRRRKVAEKVQRAGSRLVVAPVGAGA